MIGSVILWLSAILMLFFAAASLEVVGGEAAKRNLSQVKAGRFVASVFTLCGIALIVLAVRT